MKKTIILSASGIGFMSFFVTFLYFVYRYMWFTTETIPLERAIVAFVGSVTFGFIIAVTSDNI